MYILRVKNEEGTTLWTEEYRTVASLYYRAPEAHDGFDGSYYAWVEDLAMLGVEVSYARK